MQRTYKEYLDRAIPGLLHGLGNATIEKFCNSGGLQADKWEIAIPASPTANTLYSVTVDGVKVQFQTDTDPTQAELESNLFVAMRTNGLFTSKTEAELNGQNHKIILSSRFFNVPLTVNTSPVTLAATHSTTTPPPLSIIPFGRAVARKPGYLYDQAALATASSDEILGITVSTHAMERVEQSYQATTSVYSVSAQIGYKPLDVMNVVIRTSDLTGIYVETVEDNIQLTDRPYVSIALGHEGKITKSSSGTIPIYDLAKFQRPGSVELGKNVALLSFNQI